MARKKLIMYYSYVNEKLPEPHPMHYLSTINYLQSTMREQLQASAKYDIENIIFGENKAMKMDFYNQQYERTCKDTVHRILRDDPSVTELAVGIEIHSNFMQKCRYTPGSDDEEFATLGAGIASNTHLKKLEYGDIYGSLKNITHEGFFEGVKQNTSIETMKMTMLSLSDGAGRSFLNAFGKNSVLDHLVLFVCSFDGADSIQNLASMVRRCTSLKHIKIQGCGSLNGELLQEFISAMIDIGELDILGLGSSTFYINIKKRKQTDGGFTGQKRGRDVE